MLRTDRTATEMKIAPKRPPQAENPAKQDSFLMKDLDSKFLCVKYFVFIVSFGCYKRIFFQVLNASLTVFITICVFLYIPNGNWNILFIVHWNFQAGAAGDGTSVF